MWLLIDVRPFIEIDKQTIKILIQQTYTCPSPIGLLMELAKRHDVALCLTGRGAALPGSVGKPPYFGTKAGFGMARNVTMYDEADMADAVALARNSNHGVYVFLGYDLRQLSAPTQGNAKMGTWPMAMVWEPSIDVVCITEHSVLVTANAQGQETVEHLIQTIHSSIGTTPSPKNNLKFLRPEMTVYSTHFDSLMNHIRLGDVYEVNYCLEHLATSSVHFDPYQTFEKIDQAIQAPFGAFLKIGGQYALCASPERFMCGFDQRLWAQPMKGTNPRTTEGNDATMRDLQNHPKERAENIMITDLMRNDLSRSAARGTVRVDELCGVYERGSVNQMVSTVSCISKEGMHPLEAVLNAFPVGSMTGAPKLRAMELIDKHEAFARGPYSGCVGYFAPDGNFDLNVLIRTVFYDSIDGRITIPTGGAITINSEMEKEYAECMLKAEALINLLK